jgi:hypothetical protein
LFLLVLEGAQQADGGGVTGSGVPSRVILPVPSTGSAVPAVSAGSQPERLRSPRQLGRTMSTQMFSTRTCQVRVSAWSGALTSW